MMDVNAVALGLLQFVEDCLRTAVVRDDLRRPLVQEAQQALIVLDRIVKRYAPEVHPFLAFFIEHDFPKLATESANPTAALLDASRELVKARKIFTG